MIKLSEQDWESTPPNREGKFLWIPELTKAPQIITIVYYPPKAEYGIEWEGYYGVVDFRGRNVKGLNGLFCEVIA